MDAKTMQNMEEIGSNVFAKTLDEDSAIRSATGKDGPYIITVIALGEGGKQTDAGNITLSSTPGKLGAKVRIGNGKSIHLTSRAMYMPKYQADLGGGAGGAKPSNIVKVF